MTRRYREFVFRRDATPYYDFMAKFLERSLFFGDILVPLVNQNIVDEIRFHRNAISFIKAGEVWTFKNNQVRAIISHSVASKNKLGNIQIDFVTDNGMKFRLGLIKSPNYLTTPTFSKNRKDFLYRIAKHLPRIKERRLRQASFFSKLVLASILLVIVLL